MLPLRPSDGQPVPAQCRLLITGQGEDVKVTCFPCEWPGKTVTGRKATWAFKEGVILTEPPASSRRMESVSGAETGMWILIE